MRWTVRTLADLSKGLVLAPERYLAAGVASGGAAGDLAPLSSFVRERRERVAASELDGAIVLDTTHARDGLVDVGAALRTAHARPKSAKKRVRAGDLLVSRLRPYLRQISLVTPELLALFGGRMLVCSPEFYVLMPAEEGQTLAWLVPALLTEDAQAVLAAAQEGGHHPRVPRDSLLGLRVHAGEARERAARGASVCAAAAAVYRASGAWHTALAVSVGARPAGSRGRSRP